MYSEEILKKIRNYYADYYRQLGLKDIAERVLSRENEEIAEAKRISELEHLLNISFGSGQRHLIVGTGTGGLAVELYKKGCAVYGIEPNERANNIARLKAESLGMPAENFTNHKAESLPFKDCGFDFIHCISVIEHVDSVKDSLEEMIRVLKPGGYIYINTRDYRYPYEAHYKILFPTFLPKLLAYPYLLLKRRPVKYFRHIKYVNEGNINKILYNHPVIWQRIYRELPAGWKRGFHPHIVLRKFYNLVLNIPDKQEILIRKKVSP